MWASHRTEVMEIKYIFIIPYTYRTFNSSKNNMQTYTHKHVHNSHRSLSFVCSFQRSFVYSPTCFPCLKHTMVYYTYTHTHISLFIFTPIIVKSKFHAKIIKLKFFWKWDPKYEERKGKRMRMRNNRMYVEEVSGWESFLHVPNAYTFCWPVHRYESWEANDMV